MADFFQTIGAMIAAGIASIVVLFSGGAHTATHMPSPSAQTAAAVSAVEDPFHPVSNDLGMTTPPTAPADSTHAMNPQTSPEASLGTAGQASSAETTIVKQPARLNDVSRSGGYITQPVVERIIQSPPMTSGLVLGASTDDTPAQLSGLQNQINQLARSHPVSPPDFSGPAATTPVSTATFAQSQRIDNLSGTTLSNITVHGVSGLTDDDIPDDITVTGSVASQWTKLNSDIYYSTGNVGIGTTTPWGLLSINPNGISGPALVVGSSTATNFIVTNGGNVGIGTTSPVARTRRRRLRRRRTRLHAEQCHPSLRQLQWHCRHISQEREFWHARGFSHKYI